MLANHDLSDLKDMARAVEAPSPCPPPPITARHAAWILTGAVRFVAATFGPASMQNACADLARCDLAWRTSLGTLPRRHDGSVDQSVQLIAAAAAGLLGIAGVRNTRAALSFWACENDVRTLVQVANGS